MRHPRVLCLLIPLGLSCEAPPVVPSQDPAQSTQLSHIDGNVVAQTHARGNAVIFLFDATRPPPPAGSGKPIAFTVVSKDALFGPQAEDPTSAGPFTAPFHFSLVGEGNYLLEGFIDLDGCLAAPIGCHQSGFIPWYTVTDEPNAGDVGGAAADPSTGIPTVVTIDSTFTPRTGVTVGFSDAELVPLDRPAFSACVISGTGCSPINGLLPLNFAGGRILLELNSTPVPVGWTTADGSISRTLQPAFLAQWVKVVGGVPQDVDGDPTNGPDLWPKIVVRKLNDAVVPPLQDDQVDAHGVPTGPQIALAAGVVPTPDIQLALTADGGAAISTPVPVLKLTVAIFPLALDISNPAAPVPLMSAAPQGGYALYVIQPTGQTWRLPNELMPGVADPLGFVPDAGVPSQGALLQVP